MLGLLETKALSVVAIPGLTTKLVALALDEKESTQAVLLLHALRNLLKPKGWTTTNLDIEHHMQTPRVRTVVDELPLPEIVFVLLELLESILTSLHTCMHGVSHVQSISGTKSSPYARLI